jgi:hypothetical protein
VVAVDETGADPEGRRRQAVVDFQLSSRRETYFFNVLRMTQWSRPIWESSQPVARRENP